MLTNKSTVLAMRATEIAALKLQISTAVTPNDAQLKAFDTINDLRSRHRPIPDDVAAVANSYNPHANSSFEGTLGFLFALILDLSDQIDALAPAPAATPAPAAPLAAIPPVLQ